MKETEHRKVCCMRVDADVIQRNALNKQRTTRSTRLESRFEIERRIVCPPLISTMPGIAPLILASLNPETRRQAEQNLHALSSQPGLLAAILHLILDASQDRSVRLAASVFLKNTVKRRWGDEDAPMQDAEKTQLKSQLVPTMIALSAPTDKTLRAQVAETVSVIAKFDFPEQWPDLIDQLVPLSVLWKAVYKKPTSNILTTLNNLP